MARELVCLGVGRIGALASVISCQRLRDGPPRGRVVTRVGDETAGFSTARFPCGRLGDDVLVRRGG